MPDYDLCPFCDGSLVHDPGDPHPDHRYCISCMIPFVECERCEGLSYIETVNEEGGLEIFDCPDCGACGWIEAKA
jgi:Zn-finger protein